jgi:fluoroquinolone transport system permease protein
MRTLTAFRSLGPVDLKNIQRDPLLVWLPMAPLLMALVMRLGIPRLAPWLAATFGLTLESYYPLLASFFLVFAPSLVGTIVGFLLLDERDERTLTALLVTPLPLSGYLLYRLTAPLLLSTLMTLLTYPLLGLVPMPFAPLLAISLLASCSAPVLALFLASFAENKVAGLALTKMLGGVNMLPVVAYFLPPTWQPLAGIIPTYWPLKTFWLAATEETPLWPTLLLGLLINLLALALLLRRFDQIVHLAER